VSEVGTGLIISHSWTPAVTLVGQRGRTMCSSEEGFDLFFSSSK
jgi:hypothetical protein